MTKPVNLDQLQTELAAAGFDVPALGTAGDTVHTYDETGAVVELPPEAAAVLAAHVADVSMPPTRDERLLAAAEQAKERIVSSGRFTAAQAGALADAFDSLITAITGDDSP